MSAQQSGDPSQPDHLLTGIAGLDDITGGGLPARRTYLITGSPGTGKTTIGNQLAFAHAARGGQVIVATLLTESHDVLLKNLQTFRFFDPALVDKHVHYISVMTPMIENGLEATLDLLRQEIRKVKATLLIVDGTAVSDDLALSSFDLRRFAHRLEVQSSFLGCTTVLLTSTNDATSHSLWAHVNGVILLTNDLIGARHVRMLETIKMRGTPHINGTHEFTITEDGVTVFPRLESLAGGERRSQKALHGLGTGVETLDSMMGGGIMPLSTTLVMGTPGAGKTILGLHFLVEGAERGERGLLVSFHETVSELASTAEAIGLDFRHHIDSGTIQVLWNPPLELSADAWAWQVLAAMERHEPRRVFIDALTDVERLIIAPERQTMFVTAMVNELRARGATAMIAAEIDEYTTNRLTVPIPAASASMDNGILLRHVEVRGQLRRLVAVPKVRQTVSDPSIREMKITEQGMVISGSFKATSGLLTGRATPHIETDRADVT